jgi:glycosyltransferase involved in cell wall biosynthesis
MKRMSGISVVINTLNEEKNLPRVLGSVKNFADEVVVVDMRSTDRTVEIASQFGAKVYGHERTGYVEPARNFAIQKAQNDWVLILDADEKLPIELARWLKQEIKAPRADYYRIPRKNIIFGKWIKHSRWWPDYNIRFFRKNHVVWGEHIHSVPSTIGSGYDLAADSAMAIIHYHYDSVEQFIERMNRYTTQQLKVLQSSGYEFRWADLITKPASEFLSRFFLGQGYKDGVHGLAVCGLQAFSEFVLYLKAWQAQGFGKRQIDLRELSKTVSKVQKEFNYWIFDSLFKSEGGFVFRLRRFLRI